MRVTTGLVRKCHEKDGDWVEQFCLDKANNTFTKP